METLKEQEQIEQPDAKQRAMERAQELQVDVDRMKEVLRAVNSKEQVGHIPPDAYQYYGRVEKHQEEIAQLEEKYGFETALIPSQVESTVRPVADGFSDLDESPKQRIALVAATRQEAVNEVGEIAETFAAVAAAPGTTFGIPEKLLAGYIDEQLRAGNTSINLTQSYLTESPDAADARHTLALNNLLPQIEMAQKAGITFEAGEAQLASEKLKEIFAIRNTEAVQEHRFSAGV